MIQSLPTTPSAGRPSCRFAAPVPLALLLLLAVPSCGTPDDKRSTSPFAPAPDPRAPPPEHEVVIRKPWTREFERPAALVAAEIRIEGPAGLFDRFVSRREEQFQDVEEKLTPDGYRQTIRLKPGVEGAEIRAQLDELRLTALRSITVLERPGPVDVVVVGAGDAWWRVTDGTDERRGASLRFVGRVTR